MKRASREALVCEIDWAFYPYLAIHHLNQLRRNRQPQSGAAILASSGAISLRERFKDYLLLFGCDSDPGIPDAEVQKDIVICVRFGFNSHDHFTAFGKLDCVSDEI